MTGPLGRKRSTTGLPPAPARAIDNPWSRSADEVLRLLRVNPQQGLTDAKVARRRLEFGINTLRETRPRRALVILFEQVKSVVVLLLLSAGSLAVAFGKLTEGAAIMVVVLINTAIGFFTELRAARSMEALRLMGRVETTVRRNGETVRLPAEELVPGDIVLVEDGDVMTADLRVIRCARLAVDESALTGESVTVTKHPEVLDPGAHLSERANMLFKGTVVARGSGEGVVIGTGHATEIGQISDLVAAAEPEETPLEKRLDALGRRLVWVTLFIAAFVAAAGLIAGRDAFLAIQVAIALAVAAIPEGLPIVATLALARGMWRMARRNALVSRLSAVETLGATGTIMTDKTGTLTENRMTLTSIDLPGGTIAVTGTGLSSEGGFDHDDAPVTKAEGLFLDELLVVAALSNNAHLRSNSGAEIEAVGDPTEVALLVGAAKRGIRREALLDAHPEVREEPFDPELKMMATFHGADSGYLVAVKGAPEAVLDHCGAVRDAGGVHDLTDTERRYWMDAGARMGAAGLRTLAIAARHAVSADEDPYRGLVLLGLVGLLDPPRTGVAAAMQACRDAGIEVVMVTGDQLATARAVGRALNLTRLEDDHCIDGRQLGSLATLDDAEHDRLLSARIIARASPAQKLELIELHQKNGHVVAMTGDGINDAPALKKADIGVAMGVRGTQVAKEAAAMVLQDDEFGTIVEAISQGRTIYSNIRKFVVYLMSCNISEILIVGLATLAAAPLPLLPLQILFLNLVTDVFPALALGVGRGDPVLMQRPPRPADEPILTRLHWSLVFGYGALLSMVVLGAMYAGIRWLGLPDHEAVTVSFLCLAFAQLWHVFNLRTVQKNWSDNEIVRNPWIWGALGLCIVLVLAAVYLPMMRELLELSVPAPRTWLLIVAMSLVPLALGPVVRRLADLWSPARTGF